MGFAFTVCNNFAEGIEFLKLNKNLQDYNLLHFTHLDNLEQEFAQLGFFQTGNVYVIEDFFLEKETFEKFSSWLQLMQGSEYSFYFLVDKKHEALIKYLKKQYQSYVYEIPKFDARIKLNYLKKFLNKHNLESKIGQENILFLQEILPNDLTLMLKELDKLLLFQPETFTKQTLSKIIFSNDEANAFRIVEDILFKRYNDVFMALALPQNQDEKFILKLIALLANYFYKIIFFTLLNRTNKNKITKVFPNLYEIKKLQSLQNLYNISNLTTLNQSLLTIDRKFKTAQITDLYNAFRFEILKWREKNKYV